MFRIVRIVPAMNPRLKQFLPGLRARSGRRIVKSTLPALEPDSEHDLSGGVMNQRLKGFGYHEVVVETPLHNHFIWDRSAVELRALLNAMKARYLAIAED